MKEFLEFLEKHPELKEKVIALTEKEEIIALAKAHGFDLTEADFAAGGEISDDELEAVAGGDKCKCFLGGGGTGDENTRTCACVAFGAGEYKSSDLFDYRCECYVAGKGCD